MAPASSPARASPAATNTRISVFVVIRSPSPPRRRFSDRARIDSCVIWSGQMSSSLRSSRRYFGSSGVCTSGVRERWGLSVSAAAGPVALRHFRRPVPPGVRDSVPPESGTPESVHQQVAGVLAGPA